MAHTKWRAIALSICCFVAPEMASAQFGSQPTRIIFPFAAGGSRDAVARLLAERIRAETGKPVIVENRTGAAGRIGVEAVKSSPADGTTLLLTPFTLMVIYPHIYPDLKYEPSLDFAPVAQVASFEFTLAVSKEVPAKTFREFKAWLDANPEKATYGTPGAGTLPHFFGIALNRAAGLDMKHIGYRGASGAISDLTSGQLPIAILPTADVLEHHKAGSIRILATLDDKPSPYLPNVPTLKSEGYDVHGSGWFALYAPAKTPPATISRINEIVVQYAQSKEYRDRLLALGLLGTGTSPAQLTEIQEREARLWEPIIRSSGFRPSD